MKRHLRDPSGNHNEFEKKTMGILFRILKTLERNGMESLSKGPSLEIPGRLMINLRDPIRNLNKSKSKTEGIPPLNLKEFEEKCKGIPFRI